MSGEVPTWLIAGIACAGLGWACGWIAAERSADRWIERYRNLYRQALRNSDLLQTQIDALMEREPRG